ncbi:MAG: class I SAM-dependent methyltransferase [Planctomycetota bacterium]
MLLEGSASRSAVQTTPCPGCGGGERELYRAGFYQLDGEKLDLWRCKECGLVSVWPRPLPARHAALLDSEEFYDRGYAQGLRERGYFDRRDEWLDQYDREWEQLEEHVGYVGRVIEWGCGGGFFAEAARRRGWLVRCRETRKRAAEYATVEFPLEVHAGPLDESPWQPASFDVAVLHGVLPYCADPAAPLRELQRFTRPGGTLLVTVPAYVNSGWMRNLHRSRKLWSTGLLGGELHAALKLEQDHGAPFCLQHFDRGSLTGLVERCGWKVEQVRGGMPRPDFLFERRNLNLRETLLRGAFAALGGGMRAGMLPPTELRLLATRPLEA